MKPNTPTKMTMISHITYWCRWSMSRASCEPGDWKYQARAWAFAAAPRLARPASMDRNFGPFIFFFPGLYPQSSLQLGAERDARGFVQMPSQLQRRPVSAQQHVRADQLNPHPARIELIARAVLAIGHLDLEPATRERDALVVRGVTRLREERSTQQQHLQPGERQDEPGAEERKARSYRQRNQGQRRQHAGEPGRRNRAITLEGQTEPAVLLPERQLAPRNFQSRRAH